MTNSNSLYTYDNISWNLPVLFCHDEIIFAISDVMKDFKDLKRPTLFAYGSVNSPWAGGRSTYVKFFDKTFIEKHLNRVIESGFIPTFTFTKPYIKNDVLNDDISNWLLDYGVEHDCEFLVSADNLYEHIKNRHPDAKVAASILQSKMEFHNTQKRIKQGADYELNFYNERIDKYRRVVVRPEFVIEKLEKDYDKIKDISKLEVHINETCIPNCINAIRCYSSMEMYVEHENYKENVDCERDMFLSRNSLRQAFSFSLMMKKPFLDKLVYEYGIKHLKIQGRHYDSSYLFNLILYYLFNETGNFQTIYLYIIEKSKEYKRQMITIPREQKIVLEQLMSFTKNLEI